MERRVFLRTGLAGAGIAGLSATPLAASATARSLGPLFNPRRAENGPVRLSSNENALGLAPSAREAIMAGLDEANRYPGAIADQLREAVAMRLEVPRNHIFFGSGSTEILRVAVNAWTGPGSRLIYAEPTFEDVPSYAGPFPYEHVRVPLRSDYSHDVPRMIEAANESSAPTVVYFCNPNNPTGTITSCDEIDAWIETASDQTLFLIDEAYYELVDHPDYRTSIAWVRDRPNVMVVRTFSKVYAMAGMRLGYGIAHPSLVARVMPLTTKNQPNHLAGVAAVASLKDDAFYRKSVRTNNEAKAILTEALDHLEIERLPSHTNFVMHGIKGDLGTYNERMFTAGFNVGRAFPPMTNYSRLSMGLPSDMERFAQTLMDFRKKDWI